MLAGGSTIFGISHEQEFEYISLQTVNMPKPKVKPVCVVIDTVQKSPAQIGSAHIVISLVQKGQHDTNNIMYCVVLKCNNIDRENAASQHLWVNVQTLVNLKKDCTLCMLTLLKLRWQTCLH